jgi:hypothetical protein
MTPEFAKQLLAGEPLYSPCDPLVAKHVWKMIAKTFQADPPVEVVHWGTRTHLGDGRHRLAAVIYYGKEVSLNVIHRTPK